jgi:hypothetical protein
MHTGRSCTERSSGQYARENAGMSSESIVRIYTVECLRFSGEGLSTQSKSGAKLRPKGVDEAQQVDIPAPTNVD